MGENDLNGTGSDVVGWGPGGHWKDNILVNPGAATKFDPATMKVRVTNDYHISSLAGTAESNKILISDDIVLFNDGMTNAKNIKIMYKNLITSIS